MGLICTAKRQIILAVKAFEGNPHDGRTIAPLLEQMEAGGMRLPKTLAYDRGGRGPKEVHGVQVITPGKPLIGHLKYDHRMLENYLWGRESGTVNAMLAATAWTLKKLMKELLHTLMRILFGTPSFQLYALKTLC